MHQFKGFSSKHEGVMDLSLTSNQVLALASRVLQYRVPVAVRESTDYTVTDIVDMGKAIDILTSISLMYVGAIQIGRYSNVDTVNVGSVVDLYV